MLDLWDHQKKAVEIAKIKANLAIFYGMGTGKTGTMISILRDEYNKARRVVPTLIFAPLSVCQQWKNQFALFSKMDPDRILILTGSGKKRAELLEQKRTVNSNIIVVTNYEAVNIKPFYDQLLKWSPEIVILDESHMVKNSNSVRAKRIYPLGAAATRRFILTGTPIAESLMDIFGQYKFLDPAFFGASEWQFRTKYFYNANANAPAHVTWPDWKPKPHAAKMISDIIAKTSVQARKEDCLDLPPLLDVPIHIELSPDQAKAYKQMEKDFITSVDNTVVTAEFAITKTLRLRQILAGFIAENSDSDPAWFKNPTALEALKDILSSLKDERVIIWTHFRPTYKVIGALCDELKLTHAQITGDDSYAQKEKAKRAFKEGDAQILISNPAAGGTGLDFPESNVAIYYDLGYSSTQYRQSRERNHRGGSERHSKVTHYYLVYPGTISEVIIKALQNKEELGAAVLRWAKEKQK